MNTPQPFVPLIQFIRKWLSTREWRCLLYAVPAFLVAGTIAGSFAAYRSASSASRSTNTVKQAKAALKREEYQYAEFLYRKALRFDPESQNLKYWRAIALDRLEQKDAAAAAMNALASLDPTDESYPRAHMWMARSLESGRVTVKDADRDRLIVAHLQAVVQKEPENKEARKSLAKLAIQTNSLALALQHLPTILDEKPEARIVYAGALAAVKRFEEARTEAERALPYYVGEFEKRDARLEPSFFMDWARAHVLLNDFDEGRKRLYEGLVHINNRGGDNTQLRKAGSALIIQWTRYLQLTEPDSTSRQLKLLSEALKLAPDNPSILTRIAELSKAAGSDASAAMETLKQAIANGTAPPAAHFVLGTQAAILGTDFEEARRHFEKAIQLNPKAVEPINNLAWIMAHAEEPKLDLALKLADQAKKIHENHPEVRDTRGHVLILLKRYEEGIAELEYALRYKKDNVKLHSALALAYDKTGQPEMAKLHSDKVAELESAAKEQQKP